MRLDRGDERWRVFGQAIQEDGYGHWRILQSGCLALDCGDHLLRRALGEIEEELVW